MKNLHRVVWSKGMFLTPQHFQQQDLGWDALIQARFIASQYANWGVTELKIDEERLANGALAIDRAAGFLPDGLAFCMPDADEPPASRAVAEFFPPSEAALDVFLAIPEHRGRGKNFSQPSPGRPTTRWVAQTVSVVDESEGSEEKPVQLARRNFRLLFQSENLEGMTTLRIARVIRNAANQYILDPQFVAPCLDFRSSAYVQKLLRQQIEILATRGSSLMSYRRERGAGQAEFTVSEVADYWLLHTINTYLPELRHYANVRGGHPEMLFLTLLRLTSALGTFTLGGAHTGFPDYNHDELGMCFTKLHEALRSLIEIVRKTNCIVVPLEPSDRLTWTGRIAEDSYLHKSQVYLSVAADVPVSELIEDFPRLARVAGPGEIDRVVRSALTGLDLLHQQTPPQALPFRQGNQYFLISPSPVHLWDGVVRSRGLTVFVPTRIVNPKMELLILLE